ncbi:YbfB/YjiJ family MFS transporter [Motiliproteus sp.]|uniref:YbfB/YjiJ family MFS transporter n=1 Tax=Motiliproteus sp. TaxID=1898955 RepID=UPI003BA948D9
MDTARQRYQVLGAGILSLLLTLGIARFAYTPLLPLMQQQAGLGLAEGGWLAAINYLGYFCGAVVASLISDLQLKDKLYRIGLIMAVISTAAMALTDNFWIWAFWRFIAGVAGVSGMLLGAGLILNWLMRHKLRHELGIHFSGAGLGVALSALVVELFAHFVDWRGQWWLLSGLALLLAIPAWRWMPKPEQDPHANQAAHMQDNPPGKLFFSTFMLAYFCAGVGYVVSTTFISAIVEGLPGMAGQGGWVFMVIGLAAAPACILWDFIARRLGYIYSLALASGLQILGILLPLLKPDLTGAILGSILFGATFIAVVSLVLTMAGRYYPSRPAKMMGKMTLAYGTAQTLAPAVIGILAEQSGSYNIGLYLAAAVMVLGTLLMLLLKPLEARQQRLKAANTAKPATH